MLVGQKCITLPLERLSIHYTMKSTFTLTGHRQALGFHLLAFAIVAIWGTTFISSKQLLLAGLSPSDIIFYRFVIAYLCLALFQRPFRLWADHWKDEAAFLLLGLFGGTLYFLTENSALKLTYVSNVSLICSTTPLLTLLLKYWLMEHRRPGSRLLGGSMLAFGGVAVVVFNGHFAFHLHPMGDLLCFGSALCWTLYTLLIERLSQKYSVGFITRKIFFYSIVTLVPFLIGTSLQTDLCLLLSPPVAGRLFFLGFVASFLCFLLWNVCLKRLDAIVATNYIYLMPAISIIVSNLTLGESINGVLVAGTLLVIAGMYWAGRDPSPTGPCSRRATP